jgi:formylglycine-generating enzyme required for sulfatase activity
MVSVPAGSFDNGTGAVNLSAFKISNAEVTIEEYRLFDPGFPDNLLTSDLSSPLPDAVHQPVMYVNWYRALMYCNARSIAEGLTPVYRLMIFGSDPPAYSTDPAVWKVDIDHNGSPDEPYSGNIEILGPIWNAPLVDPAANGYRLPTEAQWEYAARSGSPAESYLYAGSDTRDEAAWYYGNATFLGRVVTHLPGLKKPNRLGLYDMSGNVEEWCWDWAGPYVSSPRTDPAGATAGTERAVRGGAYRYEGQEVAARASARPYYEDHARGIRLVRMNAE